MPQITVSYSRGESLDKVLRMVKKAYKQQKFDWGKFWKELEFLRPGMWIAKDSDGDWWAYTEKPTFSKGNWYSDYTSINLSEIPDITFPDDLEPEHSLRRLPKCGC
jgi:hypothetical protein